MAPVMSPVSAASRPRTKTAMAQAAASYSGISPAIEPTMKFAIAPRSWAPPSRLRSMKEGTCMALLEGDERVADRPRLGQAKERSDRRGDIREGGARAKREAGAAVQDHEGDF